ncbi:MAG TPA: Mut7-C RNAse domain-containing protein [Burkholderiales bacterium]|nr:Mut7-C RNAse domain-containing protein [Burkholderiales bacterium]
MVAHPLAVLVFDAALDRFLTPKRRGQPVAVPVDRARSAKDAIESVGVPHTEVGSLTIDGRAAALDDLLTGGERVVIAACAEEGEAASRAPRFVADAHLGKLARHLRLAGFDCRWSPDWDVAALVDAAVAEARIVLTRDKGVLRRRAVARGRFVRAVESEAQLAEVVRAFGLRAQLRPFSRCRECNVPLEDVEKSDVEALLPERVRALYTRFKRCPGCRRVYWEGTHFERLRAVLERASG